MAVSQCYSKDADIGKPDGAHFYSMVLRKDKNRTGRTFGPNTLWDSGRLDLGTLRRKGRRFCFEAERDQESAQMLGHFVA